MTFVSANTLTGTPSLVPSVVRMAAEFESIPETMRSPDDAAHVRRASELTWRVRGLEYYKTETPSGAEFSLVSCCCKTPVAHVPNDGDEMVRCAECGRDHGLAKHVEALGTWLVVESQREKRPLNRHARRRVEAELARL